MKKYKHIFFTVTVSLILILGNSCIQSAKQSKPESGTVSADHVVQKPDDEIINDVHSEDPKIREAAIKAALNYTGIPTELEPLSVYGDWGHLSFMKQDSIVLFYFDAKNNIGFIKLNGEKHQFTGYDFLHSKDGYRVYGDEVEVTAHNGKFEEIESDCAYSHFPAVKINFRNKTLEIKDVDVMDCTIVLVD